MEDDTFSMSICGKISDLRVTIAKQIHGRPDLWDCTNSEEKEMYLTQADRVIDSLTDFCPG